MTMKTQMITTELTRENIEQMEPRQIDALTGCIVMGLKVHHMTTRAGEKYVYRDGAVFEALPEYTLFLDAAGEVITKMENDDWDWQANNVIPNSDPVVYQWTFSKNGKHGYACEFTLPLAICKAAILAFIEE